MVITSGIYTEWLFVHCYRIELNFENVGFCASMKTGDPEKNTWSTVSPHPLPCQVSCFALASSSPAILSARLMIE